MTTNNKEIELSRVLAYTKELLSNKAKMAVYDATAVMIAQLQRRHNISQVNTKEIRIIANEIYLRLERECINRVLPV